MPRRCTNAYCPRTVTGKFNQCIKCRLYKATWKAAQKRSADAKRASHAAAEPGSPLCEL